jgi:hypothetical protein
LGLLIIREREKGRKTLMILGLGGACSEYLFAGTKCPRGNHAHIAARFSLRTAFGRASMDRIEHPEDAGRILECGYLSAARRFRGRSTPMAAAEMTNIAATKMLFIATLSCFV